jgi:phosphoribosyl-AMP cyclohydrolase
MDESASASANTAGAARCLLVPFTQRIVAKRRVRSALWRKGESSGHIQRLKEVRIDCDADTVLVKVEQVGGIACHTGRRSCFYFRHNNDDGWEITDEVIKTPDAIYGKHE